MRLGYHRAACVVRRGAEAVEGVRWRSERVPPAELARLRQQRLESAARPRARALGVLPRADSRRRHRARPDPGAREGGDDGALRRARDRPRAAPRRAARVDRDAPARRALRRPLPRDDHERLVRPQGPVRLRPGGLGRDRRPVPARVGVDGDEARLPRRRLAMVRGASVDAHERAGSATLRSASTACSRCPITAPIEEQVAALNRFQPDYLNAYPSAAMRLAEEQEAGRLRLSLTAMSTSSELRTPAMTERIAAAFGVAAVRPLRHHRGPVRLRVRAPRRHPPVRRREHRRERRRATAGRSRPAAGRARARHQPPQPRPADHPARGRRRDDHASRAVPVRALARPRGGDRRPPRRRALAARARRRHGERAAGAVLGRHPRPRRARVPGPPGARRRARAGRAVSRRRPGARGAAAAARSPGRWARPAPTRASRSSAAASWRAGAGSCRSCTRGRAKLLGRERRRANGGGGARRGRAGRVARPGPRPRRARQGARRRARGAPRPAADLLRGAAQPRQRAARQAPDGRARRARAAQPLRHDAPDRPPRARGHGRPHDLRQGRPRLLRRAHRARARRRRGGPRDLPRRRALRLPAPLLRRRDARARCVGARPL